MIPIPKCPRCHETMFREFRGKGVEYFVCLACGRLFPNPRASQLSLHFEKEGKSHESKEA